MGKPSEIVLVNKVILATSVNIINMVLRARSYKFWAEIIKIIVLKRSIYFYMLHKKSAVLNISFFFIN